MATSKSLVEANEGGIKVESEEGKGSTFTINLPMGGAERHHKGDEEVPSYE